MFVLQVDCPGSQGLLGVRRIQGPAPLMKEAESTKTSSTLYHRPTAQPSPTENLLLHYTVRGPAAFAWLAHFMAAFYSTFYNVMAIDYRLEK